MSAVGYGLGLNEFIASSASAYGFGINPLSTIINEAISFTTGMDLDVLNTISANKDISFNIDMLLSVVNQLDANPDISFDLEAALEVVTRMDYAPTVAFNAGLGVDFLKELIAEKSIEFGAEFDEDPTNFLVKLFLEPQNVYIIPEELRFLKIFAELRTCEVLPEQRFSTIDRDLDDEED